MSSVSARPLKVRAWPRSSRSTGSPICVSRGVRTVMLYVEADNTAAVRLYERFGFATAAADVMYRRPGTVR